MGTRFAIIDIDTKRSYRLQYQQPWGFEWHHENPFDKNLNMFDFQFKEKNCSFCKTNNREQMMEFNSLKLKFSNRTEANVNAYHS